MNTDHALGRPLTFTEKAIVHDLIRDESDPRRVAMLANREGRLRNRKRKQTPSGVAKIAKRAARGTMRRDNYFDAIRKIAEKARERIAEAATEAANEG